VELAVKGGLKATDFDISDNLLLKMYYLYENSPKKCCELQDVVESLKASFDEEPRWHLSTESSLCKP